MNKISRTVSGIGLILLGLLIFMSAIEQAAGFWGTVWLSGWGLLLIGLGVYVFRNTKEDTIEQIKSEDN